MFYRNILLFLALIALSGSVVADPLVKGRYARALPGPSVEQVDILSVIIEQEFDSSVETVGDAVKQLLVRSGYNLADESSSDPALTILLKLKLPEVHRVIGPMTLRDALKMLAGEAWTLVIDPVHRLISYELNLQAKECIDKNMSPDFGA